MVRPLLVVYMDGSSSTWSVASAVGILVPRRFRFVKPFVRFGPDSDPPETDPDALFAENSEPDLCGMLPFELLLRDERRSLGSTAWTIGFSLMMRRECMDGSC